MSGCDVADCDVAGCDAARDAAGYLSWEARGSIGQ